MVRTEPSTCTEAGGQVEEEMGRAREGDGRAPGEEQQPETKRGGSRGCHGGVGMLLLFSK